MKRLTTEEFIVSAQKIHGDKYKYNKTEYLGSLQKITIICAIHGEFSQTAHKHLIGQGCRDCGILNSNSKKSVSKKEFFSKVVNRFGAGFTFANPAYTKFSKPVGVTCDVHGYLGSPRANVFLGGPGCYKCKAFKNVVEKAQLRNPNKYDYSKSLYLGSKIKICIICPEHGEFWQSPDSHRKGRGCPQCGDARKGLYNKDTSESFEDKAKVIHSDYYDYSQVEYLGSETNVTIICPKHGEFKQAPGNHLSGRGCRKCAFKDASSKPEKEFISFIRSIGFPIVESDRMILKGKEIDVVIPCKKLCFEFNGLYWHSDRFKEVNYHLLKSEAAKEEGYQLVHVFEDTWKKNKTIVSSRIRAIMGMSSNKIGARKCEVREVSAKDSRAFLEANHLQGNVRSKIKLGLYLGDELVSLMTFGSLRANMGRKSEEGKFELLRFCNKLNTSVQGAASKLFKNFCKVYHPFSVISYADRDWSAGDVYYKMGFSFVHASAPNYFYVRGPNRFNRWKFRKSELVKQGHSPDLTEKEIMKKLGYDRIYNTGNLLFEFNESQNER